MRSIDWAVLVAALAYFVLYGMWKGRRTKDLDSFFLANRNLRWYTMAFSIMATQASAITFLSTPGQAYTDGMRFVQFYLGLPVAMVVLSITAVPIFHRLKVYTAYEYLEGRFDLKTRTLASFLFLIQRGLACGLTIYAPSVIFSVILGWNLNSVIVIIGSLVTTYTAFGGTKSVDNTNFQQAIVIATAMIGAFITIVYLLPSDVSLIDATYVAGKMGKLNAIDFSFDPANQYNFWSGLIGGCFLAMAYFGTDQSQVQRYLTGQSVAQSRLALLFNGIVKVPMQFFILFLGAMVFAFYQFVTPPVFFNPVEVRKLEASPYADTFRTVKEKHEQAFAAKEIELKSMIQAIRSEDDRATLLAEERMRETQASINAVRAEATSLMRANDPAANTNDTNYVFLTFVINYLPAGLIGLIIAAVFAASMSSTASELNALASTSMVDIYRRLIKRDARETQYVILSKIGTVFWGMFAIAFALYAGELGSLVEAVNRLGSLFYGTILGIFLLAFFFKKVRGTAAFTGAILGELVVLYCFFFSPIAFLWFNVIGCAVVVVTGILITTFMRRQTGA